MIYNIKNMNDEVAKNVYLLVVNDFLIGSTRKSDINDYLAEDRSMLSLYDYDENDTLFLYGLVLDIKELPYELPKELEINDIWLFQKIQKAGIPGMVKYEIMSDMEEATDAIEQIIVIENVEIDDFAIVIGLEMDLVIQVTPGTFKVDARHIF